MIGPFGNTAVLLIQFVFSVYIALLLVRILLQWHDVDFYNPISQFVVKFTDPVLQPVRSILPRFARFGIAFLLILIVLEAIKLCLLFYVVSYQLPSVLSLLQSVIASLLEQLLNLFFYAILMRVILSWVITDSRNVLVEIVQVITEPLLRPVRNSIPSIAGFDLSPLIVLIGLKLVVVVVIEPFLVLM